MIRIAPSILSADFVNLERDIRHIESCGADYIHVDVMDGIFVPNITIGIPVTAAIKRIASRPLDVHLMIDRPLRYVEDFLKAGADILTLHVEADSEACTRKALELIRAAGKTAAVSVKPGTPAEAALPFMELCGLVLVMTVEPGFGGQSFMADMVPKIAFFRRLIDEKYPGCALEVDGGVNPQTSKICREAGADVLVAGSALFKAEDRAEMIGRLRGCC